MVPGSSVVSYSGALKAPSGAGRNGIPPQVVMKWTGHKDYKTMKPYIDSAEKVKAEQMAIFEKNLRG